MSKKKEEKEEKAKVSSALISCMRHAEQKNGKEGEYVTPNYEEVVMGVPINNLALMYLIDSNVLPVSKIIKVAGPTGSNKSALGFDLMRMLMHPDGYCHYIENEGGKWSPLLVKSIVGDETMKRFHMNQATDSSEAMKIITSDIKFIQKGESGGKVVGLLLDSLAGSNTEKATEKMYSSGEATRGYSELALLWTNYFQTILSPGMVGLPMGFVFINHLKDKTDDMGNKSHGSPGGVAQDFYSGIIIWTNAMNTTPVERVKWEIMGKDGPEDIVRPHFIRTIRLSCVKTSFGTGSHRINVDFIWWFDEAGVQRSIFDWDASAANLVLSCQGNYGNLLTGGYAKLEDICEVTETQKRFSCKRLSMKGVSAHLLGEAIHADAQLMKELQFFLHIKQHKAWHGKLPTPPKPKEEVPVPPQPQDEQAMEKELTKKKRRSNEVDV